MSLSTRVMLLVGSIAALLAMAIAEPGDVHASPFDQSEFPCQEDEVLGFSPSFGPEHVGCIHIEDLALSVEISKIWEE